MESRTDRAPTVKPLREQLAAYAHDAWAGWMRYLFSQCLPGHGWQEGVVVPRKALERWRRQMATPYANLSEAEKDSDRREADKMLAIVNPVLDAAADDVTTLRNELCEVHDTLLDIRKRLVASRDDVDWVTGEYALGEVPELVNEAQVALVEQETKPMTKTPPHVKATWERLRDREASHALRCQAVVQAINEGTGVQIRAEYISPHITIYGGDWLGFYQMIMLCDDDETRFRQRAERLLAVAHAMDST